LARKPHNVVGRYIEYYTDPGDTVLDPFMGSGVTVIEATRLKRHAIGVDLNPIACFIAHMTLAPVKVSALQEALAALKGAVESEINRYYQVLCSKCGDLALSTHFVWKSERYAKEKMFQIHVACPHCGSKLKRKPTHDDLDRYSTIADEPIPFFYPRDIRLHATAKRSVDYIHELFTHRALIALSILRNEIQQSFSDETQSLLMFAFTSTLAQVSRMPPVAPSSGISWKVPNYWVPPLHWERNVWGAFEERTKKLLRGKEESTALSGLAKEYARIFKGDATDLRTVASNSVDYIFTDPPYGNAVPYFGLSLMWAAWLGCDRELDFESEIIISERANYEQELEDYRNMLKRSFAEMHRVLRSNGTVTVTFHNREIRVWNALVAAAFDAGFVYENDNYVLPAVKSSKSQLASSGSMTGDIYINFRKPAKAPRHRELNFDEVNEIITGEAKLIIQSRNGQATTDQLARGIYSHLIKENLFNKLPSTDIRKVLATLPIVATMPNVWSLQKTEPQTMLAYIPLTRRVEFIIDSVLESKSKHGYGLDDFLIPIFTQLKNGLTPENKEIMDVLKQRAKVKRDKWFPFEDRQPELLPEFEVPKRFVLPEDELREHEQFIYQLAKLGTDLGFGIWVGKNEQNKTELLQTLSVRRLEIPGISEKFISDNRIDQIDLIWLQPDEGKYIAFEIENSTGVVPGIQRLANLTGKLSHIRIPTFIVIPDKFRGMAKKIFESPSGQMLSDKQRGVIVYSRLLHAIDLLHKGLLRPAELLESISETA
jgi:DNA modification methylase